MEVPIGGPEHHGDGARERRIDAVRLPGVSPGDVRYYDKDAFHGDLAGEPLEILEVKKDLNRPVIGQLIAARDLATLEWDRYGPIQHVAVCEVPDTALEGVCNRNGIHVAYVERDQERR